ncbi:MAG: ShlB/FhaC/HecB family hemolysin secretion/activation protein [Phycisphaerales bacterium]|nr:MAG: ShlB/FhaC/HecB family hemolysin secretion/activation protein [Phycisphaerales bacterium]
MCKFFKSLTTYIGTWNSCNYPGRKPPGDRVIKMWLAVICMGLAARACGASEMMLPEDTSVRLTVRELRISGNRLISTDRLIAYMPEIFNASDQPLLDADSKYLYDLRVIREIAENPGQPRDVSTRTIQGLTQYILSVYRNEDYSGIYVYVPEGAIVNGIELVDDILPINIIEAPVGEVRIKYFDAERNEVDQGYLKRSALQRWSPAKRDKVASQKALDYLINLLNLNPDRHVTAVVSSGAEPNTLAIEYDVHETSPWHFFVQADNSGTSDRQWSPRIGVINTNLLGIDDRLTALYQAAVDDYDGNYSIFGSYDVPVTSPRLRLNVFGGYSEFDINPESGPIDFIGGGKFYGAVLRYNLAQKDGWFLDISGSVSHEESRIDPSLFPQFFSSDVEMDLWGLGINAYRRNDTSNTSLLLNGVRSFGSTDRVEFARARTGADTDFSIYTFSATHNQYVDADKVQQVRGTGRYILPTERLVPAKMTSFGGMYSVRGYDEYEIVADGGVLTSLQYEYDLVRHHRADGGKALINEELRKLAPLAFVDFGRTKIKDPVPGEDEHETLLSIGVGTIFEIGSNFSGAIYYGHPLEDTATTRKGKGRINASAMIRW